MRRQGEDESLSTADAPDRVELTILHVNDTHGRLLPQTADGRHYGGYARLASLVEQLRAPAADRPTPRHVFLVHAGDVLSRGDALTRRTRGAANVALMNHLGFDAWTPGNGEFYDGVTNLKRLIRQADFPVLAANVLLEETGEPIADRYTIRRVGPVRIAFFGLCFVRTRHRGARGLEVLDHMAVARELVPKLAERADVVVALAHRGLGDDLRLADEVAGIDVIIGGHTHTMLPRGRRLDGPDGREVLICQAGDYVKYLGEVNLALLREGDGYRVAVARARVHPLNESVPLDPTVTALIARMSARGVSPTPEPALAPEGD